MIIEGAEPFFLQGNSTGILLIHGFTGSPAELTLMGNFLNRAGFTVLGVRLAGHGTSERDIIRTTKYDWFDSVLDGYAILKNVCEKIFVAGHSMGGLLSLKLASMYKVEKIVTLAAPIFISLETDITNLPPRERCGENYVIRPRRNLKDVPSAANKVYRKTPLINVHELLDLIVEIKNILPKITSPILIMHGEEDHTAQPKSSEYIEKNIGSKISRRIMIPESGHLLPLIEKRDFVFQETLNFFQTDF